MDIVYLNRTGENPELLYSLRSLKNLPHGKVWVFGGAPSWLNTDVVKYVHNPERGSPYSTTRAHLAAAVRHPGVSDPFILFNDDFWVMRRVATVKPLHRGPLADLMEKANRIRTPWWKGLIEAERLLKDVEEPLCYDIHVPMVIDKRGMQEALNFSKKMRSDAVPIRTLYGNLTGVGGDRVDDPKIMNRTDPFPRGPWLSANDAVYQTTIEPVLRYLFPSPSPYEKV